MRFKIMMTTVNFYIIHYKYKPFFLAYYPYKCQSVQLMNMCKGACARCSIEKR